MFGKNSGKPSGSIGTLISSASSFEGNLDCDGAVKIEGRITGNVKASGDVYIGKAAVVTGDVSGNNIYLYGAVKGQVHTSGMLRLYANANLNGDIGVHSFVADEGAVFEGNCHMIEAVNSGKSGKLIKPGSIETPDVSNQK